MIKKRRTDQKRKKILLADDSLMQLIMTRSIFESWDLEVDSVENGVDVISKCLQTDYDVVLIDSEMPGPDSEAIVKQLRKNIKYAGGFPIFVVTTTGNQEKNSHASEIFSKPLIFPQIRDSLMKYLRQS
jgi:CheY-like chemotaxis protein